MSLSDSALGLVRIKKISFFQKRLAFLEVIVYFININDVL